MDESELVLDGNALAGLFGELFVHDVTIARGRCGACGTVGEMGAATVYRHAPGAVVRCRTCNEILLVIVRRDDRYVLAFEHVRSLEFYDETGPHSAR
jgi:hypothetical protein